MQKNKWRRYPLGLNPITCSAQKIFKFKEDPLTKNLKDIFVSRSAIIFLEPAVGKILPPGSLADWTDFVINYKNNNNLDKVEAYYKTIDEESGQMITCFLCEL